VTDEDELCQACRAEPDFSIVPDAGDEILACAAHLAVLVASLFDQRLASGELKVYDVRHR
jgi:hypothetical protein